jgi:mRNA-degrading endonuclease RelE of RelBE toxin-antitoxin system
MTSRLPVRVLLAPPFVGKVNRLHKKYRHVWSDVQPLIDQLKRGETPGDQVQGVTYPADKVRVRNSDLQRGKSGGYRIIYYIRTTDLVWCC